MEVIALTGTYDPEIKSLIQKMVPDEGFVIKEITSASQYDELIDANYIILRILSLNEEVINSLPNLKLIQRWGAGYDKVDVRAAGKRNIPVAITPGMNSAAVSEMALLLMLAVYRKLIQLPSDQEYKYPLTKSLSIHYFLPALTRYSAFTTSVFGKL